MAVGPGDRLTVNVLVLRRSAIVIAHQARHDAFGPADPVEAIRFRWEQEGLTPRQLALVRQPAGISSSARAARRRPPSIASATASENPGGSSR